MSVGFRTLLKRLLALVSAVGRDSSGQVLIIFALASVGIFAGLGAGIDLATAYAARQRLSEAATLACQYSTRPSVTDTASATYSGTNGFATYVSAVNAYAASSLSAEHWSNATPTGPTGAAGAYFTATPAAGGPATVGASPTNPTVEMSAAIPTAFGRLLSISSITVHAKITCQTLPPQIVNPGVVFQEGLESQPCTGYCFYTPTGSRTSSATPSTLFPPTAGYTGYGGRQWYIVGYCLETDMVGVISASVPEGTHSAELDCDNGAGSKGNSSMSTKVYLPIGQYELQYYYRSRIDYPDYDPTYLCGSTVNDLAWANSASGFSPGANAFVSRTNQINVYLDANLAGTNGTTGSAPLHVTLDGTQHLAGANLIDECVYSPTWVARSIRIKITTPDFYWLSFAADGANDSYGGQIDKIRLCQELCSGALPDSFPASWAAVNNGGVNKTLFEDTFDSPTYTQDYPYHYIAKSGNPNQSVGTSGSPNAGWPGLGASGWAVAPFNQFTYALNGAYQGSQYIALDGFNANGDARRDRLISRPFLLDPGYYQVSYDYISMVNFNTTALASPPCQAAPASGLLLGTLPTATGTIRYDNPTTTKEDTNLVAAFLANAQLISTPIGGGAQGSATSYSNPDTTISTTPTVAPDGFSLTNYDATQVNPLLDLCVYSDAFAWVPRSIAVKITKPGYYWLSFSAQAGTADGDGGAIDDVKLTALGSPFMASPPASPLVAIPVPDPQPDSSDLPSTYAGFAIVADPFTPPGADQ